MVKYKPKGVNEYKSKWTYFIKKFRMTLYLKTKAGWSRATGAGFIAEDLDDVDAYEIGPHQCSSCGQRVKGESGITLFFKGGALNRCINSTAELNLRETEELLKFCMAKRKKERNNEVI